VQFVNIGTQSERYMPPPSFPAVFEEKMQLINIGLAPLP
jgi:hypothetical protein